MTCPICGGETKIVDSVPDCDAVYRCRKCKECEHQFHTTEFENNSDVDNFYELKRKRQAERRASKRGGV